MDFISLPSSTSGEVEERGIVGDIQDELGNPVHDVSISYRNFLIKVQTNADGNFEMNQPTTMIIDFKKEGYQILSTKQVLKISNFKH